MCGCNYVVGDPIVLFMTLFMVESLIVRHDTSFMAMLSRYSHLTSCKGNKSELKLESETCLLPSRFNTLEESAVVWLVLKRTAEQKEGSNYIKNTPKNIQKGVRCTIHRI